MVMLERNTTIIMKWYRVILDRRVMIVPLQLRAVEITAKIVKILAWNVVMSMRMITIRRFWEMPKGIRRSLELILRRRRCM